MITDDLTKEGHTVESSEGQGLEAFGEAAAFLRHKTEGRGAKQPQKDIAAVFEAAALARDTFEDAVQECVAKSGADVADVKVDFKGCARVVEKAALRPDQPGCGDHICDLCRAMVVCKSMGDVAAVVKAIGKELNAVRVKDRFTSGTPSGWRDVLVSDPRRRPLRGTCPRPRRRRRRR